MARTMTAAGVSVHPRGRGAHRAAVFLPPPAAALFVWYRYLHEAGRYDGLGLLFAAFLLLWPPLMVAVFLQPGCTVKALVPVKTRAAHRKKVRERHRRARERAGTRHRAGDDRGNSAQPRAWLKYAIMAACRRRCVYCHVKAATGATLEFDHYRPHAGGGNTSVFNVLMLCHQHNMIKSNFWVDDDGYVHYHPWPGYNDPATAARILHAERLHLRNPLHWIRAAWGIG